MSKRTKEVTKEAPKAKKEKKAKPEAPKKKSTGLRSAVRLGEVTPDEALKMLEDAKGKGEYVGEEIVNWLKHRKKLKNRPANPVEEEEDTDVDEDT